MSDTRNGNGNGCADAYREIENTPAGDDASHGRTRRRIDHAGPAA